STGTFTVSENRIINFNGGGAELTGADFFGAGTVEFGSGTPNLTGTYNLDPLTGKTILTNGVTTFSSGMNLISLGNELEVNARSFAPELQLNRSPSVSPEMIRLPNNGKLVVDEGVRLDVRKMEFISGTLRGNGTVSVSDTVDWPGGRLGANLIIEESAYLKMGSFGTLSRRIMEAKSTVEINGTAEWQALQIIMADSSVITVNGILEMTGSSFGNGITVSGFINKLGTIVNNGTIHHRKNTGAITIRAIIENYGIIKLESLLRMQGETGNNNSYYAGGGVINQREGRIEGTGTIQFLNGQAGRPDESFFENYGTVAPGLSAGTFTWNNRFSAEPGAVLEIELGGLEEGVDNDLLTSPYTVSLGGTIEVKFIEGYVPVTGQKFKVLRYGNRAGTFQNIDAPIGFTFKQNYIDDQFSGEGYLELEVIKALDNPLDEIVFTHPTVEHLGHALTMGDFNGDGADDLAIAGLKNLQALKDPASLGFEDSLSAQFISDFEIDTVFVVYDAGSITGGGIVDISVSADLKITPTLTTNDRFGGGNGALHAADLTGDGQDELFVGGLLEGTSLTGGVFIFDFSILEGQLLVDESDALSSLRASNASLNYPEVIKTGDISDNNSLDVVLGFPGVSASARNTGLVAFWSNSGSGFQLPQYINTDVAGNHLGKALDIGDVDGDGVDDLAIIAGGEIVENSRDPRIECVDKTFDGSAFEDNYYTEVVANSNPGKGILIYGPVTSGGNISTGYGDTIINGEFRKDPYAGYYSGYYATFSSTLLHDFNGDGKAEWYIGESFPRSLVRSIRIKLLKNPFDVCTTDYSTFAFPRLIAGRSVAHWFNPDDLLAGTTLDESQSVVSYAEAGRSLLAVQMSGDLASKDLVFSGDIGEVRVQEDGPHDDLFILDNDIIPGDSFDNIVYADNYSFDFALGTEDTRTYDFSYPFEDTPYSYFSGYGQTLTSGFIGSDDIEDLLVGSPYYLPENPSDPIGRVFLFLSDGPVNPPVVDIVSGIDSTGRWQFLGSPNIDEPYNSILSNVWTQGITGASSITGSPSVLNWDEVTQAFIPVTNLNEVISNGKGFITYLFEDDDPVAEGIQGGWPKLLVSQGTQKIGDAALPVTYTEGTDPSLNGFNLVSNPYNETVDWDAIVGWTKTNVNDAIYIWDGTANNGNGAYKQRAGGVGDPINLIAPLQGFFVQASDAGAVLTVTEEAKTTGGTLLKSQNREQLSVLNLNISTTDFDDTAYIVFRDEAKLSKDGLDAIKLQPLSEKSVQLFTSIEDSIPLAINSLPKNVDEVLEIPLYLETSQTGEYTLSWEMDRFPDNWKFNLTDHKAGVTTELNLNNSYDFQVLELTEDNLNTKSKVKLKTTNTVSANRFTLQIIPGIAVSTEPFAEIPTDFSLKQNYPNPFNPTTVINYSVPVMVEVNLTVYDMLGKRVTTLVNENKSPGRYSVTFDASSLSSGIYIYRLNVGSEVITKRMTLIK
ncbi:MAG TPA: T9SS type A sorting domain-containing protein, partial [Gracilimonas sp.]|nr:T9SS type A sorting domain-containing protein [Gracilimonas sp.]